MPGESTTREQALKNFDPKAAGEEILKFFET
jgi:hypothetical protein